MPSRTFPSTMDARAVIDRIGGQRYRLFRASVWSLWGGGTVKEGTILVLALFAMATLWLASQYQAEPTDRTLAEIAPTRVEAYTHRRKEEPPALEPASPATVPGSVIYKCISASGVSYSESPCNAQARQEVVRTDPTDARSRSYKEQYENFSRAKTTAIVPEKPRFEAASSTNGGDMCAVIDQQIAAIDSRLRQTYLPAEGDSLNERKRKLYQKRMSEGC